MTIMDEQTQEILVTPLKAARAQIKTPCVGDYLQYESGQLERVCQVSPGSLRTFGKVYPTSIHLHHTGEGYYSGQLNVNAIELDSVFPTNDYIDGEFWIFHNGISTGGRHTQISIPCRVFKTTTPYNKLNALVALSDEELKSLCDRYDGTNAPDGWTGEELHHEFNLRGLLE